MVNHSKVLRVEVAPFRYSAVEVIREAWRADNLYIIHNDVNGEARFFIAERVFDDVFGGKVRVISSCPFTSVRAAYRIAAASQRLFKREVAYIPHTPSFLNSALRAIVADFAMAAMEAAR